MADNKKLLQAAKKNLETLGNELSKNVAANLKADSITNATDSYLQLTDVKESFTRIYGKLKNIPDEVYTKIAATLIKNIDDIVFTEYSSDKLLNQIGDQIEKIFTKIDDQKIIVDGKTYKISFKGSRLGLKGKFIRVSDGDKESWLNWDNSGYGKSVMARYAISVFKTNNFFDDATFPKILSVLNSNGYKLFSAILKDESSLGSLKKVLGNKLFKAIGAERVQSKLENLILSVSDEKISDALSGYVSLSNAYNELETAINSTAKNAADDIKSLTNSFTSTAKKIQSSLKSLGTSVKLETLPEPAADLVYNAKSTAVTLAANFTSELKTSDYKDSVKTIHAETFTKSVTINGNDKANVIYAGSGNDKIYGGKGNDKIFGDAGKDILYGGNGNDSLFGDAGNDKIHGGKGNDIFYGGAGNDSLWGDAGADKFFYEAGDGKDVIFGFDNNDTLTLDGLDFKASCKNSALILTVDGGSVTLKDFTATTFHINDDVYKISGKKFVKQ